MQVTVEKVTPKIAEKWLNEHNNTNRTLREGVAEQYARDMMNGHWTECPDPIVFYEDGDLANGQHRLYAIVESQTTQTFTIHRGLPRSAGLNMDTGLGRTIVDNGRISGADLHLSNSLVSTARAVALGEPSGGRMSASEKLELVETHRDACAWAMNALPYAKNITNAVILGALSRAWYHESDHVRLAEYAQIVSTGFAQSEDYSPL